MTCQGELSLVETPKSGGATCIVLMCAAANGVDHIDTDVVARGTQGHVDFKRQPDAQAD